MQERTRTATDIEQVLGALSMLLNGGGLSQLTPIVNELNKALGNDGTELRSLLETTQTLIGGLNRQRDDIVSAIEGLNRLSVRTNAQTEQIDRILGELPEAVKVLEDQRPQFVDLLTKLDTLEDAARREGFLRVRLLHLEAGQLAGVEVQSLRFALEALAPGTCLQGAELRIDEPAGQAWCEDCRRSVAIAARGEACPHCGGAALQVTGGTDLRVVDLLVEDH